jgi:hypothetical protein
MQRNSKPSLPIVGQRSRKENKTTVHLSQYQQYRLQQQGKLKMLSQPEKTTGDVRQQAEKRRDKHELAS